jgi:hypothetical protein
MGQLFSYLFHNLHSHLENKNNEAINSLKNQTKREAVDAELSKAS